MAFDFFGQESLVSNQQSDKALEDALSFKPTMLNGKQWQSSSVHNGNQQNKEQIISSFNNGMPIQQQRLRDPLSTDSNLGKLLQLNEINLSDVDSVINADEIQQNNIQSNNTNKSKFDDFFRKMNQTIPVSQPDPFEDFKEKEGNFRSWDVDINQNLTRYEKSGDNVNKIPFNPYRNNEQLYRERMSNWDDTRRAFSGFWETMKLGITDSIGIGSPIDTNAAETFDIANKIGSSSKTGGIRFLNNMIISAGYTGGILLEIAAEGLALAGIETAAGIGTPVTGGASLAVGAAAGARMTANIARNVSKLGKAIQQLSKSATWRNFGKSAFEALNPLDDIIKFSKSTKIGGAMQGASNIQKLTGYTTSAWRGFNKIKFAYEESAMEAGTTYNETKKKAIQDFYEKNGRMPREEELSRIIDLAKSAAYNTFAWNMPLIYGSNAFVFDSLLRPSKYAGKGIARNAKNNIAIFKGKLKNGKKGLEAVAVPKTWWGKTKTLWQNPKLAASMLKSNASRYVAENTVEGLQEVFQDWFQESSQQQFNEMYSGSPERGSYYKYLLSNASNMFSNQGLESFASGFLMQMLISPIAKFSASINSRSVEPFKEGGPLSSAVGSGLSWAGNKIQGMTNKEMREAGGYDAYMQNKEKKKKAEWEATHPEKNSDGTFKNPYQTADERLQSDIDTLNDYFNDPLKYLNPSLSNSIEHRDFTEYQNECNTYGDKIGYIDAHNEDQMKNITTLLQYGGFNKVNEVLDSLLENTTKEEFDSNNYGITYDEYVANIEATRNYAKNIQNKKDNLDDIFENPFHLEYYDEGTPEWQQACIGWSAYEKAKNDILFQQLHLEDSLNRIDAIGKKVNEKNPMKNTPYHDIGMLTNENDMLYEISQLANELSQIDEKLEGKLDSVVQKQLDIKRKKFEHLKKILDLSVEISGKKLIDNNADTSQLENVIKEYLQERSKESGDIIPSNEQIKETVEYILDSYNLGRRAKLTAQSVNILMDPGYFSRRAEENQKWMTDIMSRRKEEIAKSVEEFERQTSINEIMRELHAIGVFFDPDDYDMLKEKNLIPTLYFFGKELSGEKSIDELDITSDKYSEAVAIISKFFPNVHGAKIRTSERVSRVDNIKEFEKDTRTLNDLTKEYDISFDSNGEMSINTHDLIDKIIKNKNASERQKSLANALKQKISDSDTIIISRKQNQAISYDVDTSILRIDPRYSSSEYDESYIGFEDLVNRALLTKILSSEFNRDSELKARIEELRQEALQAIDEKKSLYPFLAKIGQMDNEIQFACKALTDMNFAKFLNGITSKVPGKVNENTLWKRFIEALKKIFATNPNSVLNGVEENLSQIFPNVEPIRNIVPTNPVSPSPTTKIENVISQIDDTRITNENLPPIGELKNYDEHKTKIVEEFKKTVGSNFNNLKDDDILNLDEFKNYYNTKGVSIPVIYNWAKYYSEVTNSKPENSVKSLTLNDIDEIIEIKKKIKLDRNPDTTKFYSLKKEIGEDRFKILYELSLMFKDLEWTKECYSYFPLIYEKFGISDASRISELMGISDDGYDNIFDTIESIKKKYPDTSKDEWYDANTVPSYRKEIIDNVFELLNRSNNNPNETILDYFYRLEEGDTFEFYDINTKSNVQEKIKSIEYDIENNKIIVTESNKKIGLDEFIGIFVNQIEVEDGIESLSSDDIDEVFNNDSPEAVEDRENIDEADPSEFGDQYDIDLENYSTEVVKEGNYQVHKSKDGNSYLFDIDINKKGMLLEAYKNGDLVIRDYDAKGEDGIEILEELLNNPNGANYFFPIQPKTNTQPEVIEVLNLKC